MSRSSAPVETFVSSLDFTFPDEWQSDGEDEAAVASGSSSAGTGSTGGPAQPSKGRNSASIVRPNARARASKTTAIEALTTRVEKGVDAASSKRNPAHSKTPRAPPLDFSTLRTSAPRLPNPPPLPPGQTSRMFGLEHAPVYHPTVDEFAQGPMVYVESIAHEAKEYGICKIVPPEGWRPPFALNTETFQFKTRLQRLNSMEASARASLNFLEQLFVLHRQQGTLGDIAVPTIGGKPLDLWRLKREVTGLGGYTQVTNGRKWTLVAKNLGYGTQASTFIASQLKTTYLRIVVPFEDYVKRVKLAGGMPPPDPSILHDDDSPSATELASKLNPGTPKDSNGAASLATPRSDNNAPVARPEMSFVAIDKVRTASDKLNDALKTGGTYSKLVASLSIKAAPVDDTPGEVCEICSMDHDPDMIVLCDGCDRGYHLSCLSPPLTEVPASQFFCDTCLLMNGAEYGFEEGQDHSLHSFRKRADAFKRKWLDDHPLPPSFHNRRNQAPGEVQTVEEMMEEQLMIEDHFEREFWRLTEDQNETVEVEYGADVNLTNEGGGMPNLEVHPNDPYSRDGWNLNNLPILPGSLLRYIKEDISGMTIPWIYIGMVFSTFAWHKEDHYTYSINYHHWGDTKTWYGIPSQDDEKLERAMMLAAPELFEQQPDIMFQLVTLMSPGRLQKHGVRVVACDQRPNEFIITFPRAYHSGFNHGFNFNEAVNFALPDWLPTGLKCVNRYRDIKKNPVFSHDELLVTIAQHEKSPKSSQWLLPNWKELIDRELATREKIRRLVPGLPEVVDSADIDEDKYQCESCRVLSYLSHVTAVEGKKTSISCLPHWGILPEGPKVLRLRFSDDELRAMLAKVKSRSDKGGRNRPSTSDFGLERDQQRTTGRKRKPSALAVDAAAGDILPPSTKPRLDYDTAGETGDEVDYGGEPMYESDTGVGRALPRRDDWDADSSSYPSPRQSDTEAAPPPRQGHYEASYVAHAGPMRA